MAHRCILPAMILGLGLLPGLAFGAEDDPPATDRTAVERFDQKIAPLLARRCLTCHGAQDPKGGLNLTVAEKMLQGGESGPAIVPGQPEESLLWERIVADEMPPKKPLPAEEKELLRAWIADGAGWGSGPVDLLRYTTEQRAGYDWWALQPVAPAEPPAVERADWPRNPIDRFILAKLELAGLTPSPEADRRRLIRRLSFDLRGLPPSPEEMEQFLQDAAPDAYERLVDRFLASPAYGERWARHWLDVVRYAESQGFERDKLRPNAWAYRDWVVAAWNQDLPYDEFIRLQIAGDVVRPDDPRAVIATGFLVAGPYDEVGQQQQSAAMKAVVRLDELDDVIAVTSQTFLGLTVHCARCHDHKFDSVTQTEYYQLSAALGGLRHGERETLTSAGKEAVAAEVTRLTEQLAGLRAELEAIDLPVRTALLEAASTQPLPEVPAPLAAWEFDGDLRDSIGQLHGEARGGAVVRDGQLILDGKEAYAVTAPLEKPLIEKTLEVWLKLPDRAQRGGGALGVQTLDGKVFDSIVYAEREEKKWIAGSNGFVRTQDLGGEAETAEEAATIQITVVSQADKSITLYRNGLPYGKSYAAPDIARFEAGRAQITWGIRHSPPGGNRMLAAAIDRAKLYDRPLTPAQVAATAGIAASKVTDADIRTRLDPAGRLRRDQLVTEITRLETEQRLLAGGKSYAIVPQQPEVTHRLNRGSPVAPQEAVVPAGIRSLQGISADFQLAADAPEADRRRKLADWLTDPANPLPRRVIVNRLWHYHFGTGIVDSPNDFGFNGGRPTHPELLDWLATELLRGGWRLKPLQRQIVLSATYRQSSQGNAVARERDAENRLLWRVSPRRLEAEEVRDAILVAAGQLNPAIGGPGYKDFKTFVSNTQFYEMIDPVGFEFQRRSLYRTWVRSGRNGMLDALDCPDPSTTAPKRVITTTPLQALALLNNSFVLRMADQFAARLQLEAGAQPEAQVRLAFQLAYHRDPAEEETALAVAFISKHGLPAFCRVLFNGNEFLYAD